MRGRHQRWLWVSVAGAVLVGLVVAGILLSRMPPGPPSSAPRPVPSPGPAPSPGQALSQPVLAVKIDNVEDARPQTGLGSANVVYVEPVEGGLTRLMAVYFGTPPPVIGPVRSARTTDIGVLAQYGKPTLAYSGAAPEILPTLRSAPVVNASPAEVPDAYFRAGSRPAPHNMFVRPSLLPVGEAPATNPVPESGSTPAGGVPATSFRVGYSAASFGFTWSANAHRWSVAMDGTPVTSTDSGPVTAATVVEQRVDTRPGDPGESGVVAGSPVARTVGTGAATVLRDGQSFAATWTRPDPGSPMRLTTPAGNPLPLAPGPVWILLTPR
ncbi:DUF3048 domain-containing protein [Amycolatopsis taiwanensis]|uniref:DUF3048 domain-containing protein n=1 Tax=Amycolatopsis taiwanensis TaxID=342230 RepID=UPI0004829DBB|nr:DUF3048 domain-containing protein [Amycolatopsis taiwanensis]